MCVGKVAREICVSYNTDEITDYETDVRCVVMNFELFIEESSRFDSWSCVPLFVCELMSGDVLDSRSSRFGSKAKLL